MIGYPRVGTMHVGMCLRCLGPLVQKAERYGCDVRNGGAIFQPDRHEYCAARSHRVPEEAAAIEAEWKGMTPDRRREMIAEYERENARPPLEVFVRIAIAASERDAKRDMLAGLVDP